MANIKELILSIEAPDSSFDEKLAAITEMQATVEAMQAQEEQAINDNVDLIVEALRNIEAKVEAKLKAIPEKGEQGIQGPKGDQGDRGRDGLQGKDGLPGRDGKNGLDGKDGISVQDAKIDFDGSLVITLSDGREINVGEVVPLDVAENIHKVTHSIQSGSGGDSQTTLNAIAALQATIATYGTMATQNANNVAITGGTIDNTVIGGTTPAAGTFTTLTANSTSQFGRSSANYWQATGGATTKGVQFQALGTDTNISQVFQSKGTGAIDLAAGSSGVNISNGGTVTAITRTATGSAYTSFPSVAITAPTTAGGVQATATVATMVHVSSTVQSGGTGYTVNDVLTVVGGTPTASAATMTVTAVSGGVITAATPLNFGQYTVLPTNPVSVTGGTGSGATFNLFWGIGSNPSFTITNAGSGYVEQPTVSFSGGGGSGAAAYATVGSDTTIKSLGTSLFLNHANGIGLQIRDAASGTTPAYPLFQSSSTTIQTYASGTSTTVGFQWATKGATNHSFSTNASVGNEQFRVAHTASAVNYVQVTGAATGTGVSISSQGTDSSIGLNFQSKGVSGTIGFGNTTSLNHQAFRVATGTAVNTGNLILVTGAVAGSSPSIAAISGTSGTDTDIDLTLTPKGAGNVRFGTYTAGVLTPTGYITIKDSGGTTRRLLVG